MRGELTQASKAFQWSCLSKSEDLACTNEMSRLTQRVSRLLYRRGGGGGGSSEEKIMSLSWVPIIYIIIYGVYMRPPICGTPSL